MRRSGRDEAFSGGVRPQYRIMSTGVRRPTRLRRRTSRLPRGVRTERDRDIDGPQAPAVPLRGTTALADGIRTVTAGASGMELKRGLDRGLRSREREH